MSRYDPHATRLWGYQVTLNTANSFESTVLVPRGSVAVRMYAPNVAFEAALQAPIVGIYFYDGNAASDRWRDRGSYKTLVSDLTDDIGAYTTGHLLKGSSASDFLYVGFGSPLVDTLNVTINGANDQTATITIEFWNGTDWTAWSITDNTSSGGKTLAITDSIAWTNQNFANWKLSGPNVGPGDTHAPPGPMAYWIRMSWSATLGDATTIEKLVPEYSSFMNVAANYRAATEYALDLEKHGVGGLTLKTNSTDTIDVNFQISVDDLIVPPATACVGCQTGAGLPNGLAGPVDRRGPVGPRNGGYWPNGR